MFTYAHIVSFSILSYVMLIMVDRDEWDEERDDDSQGPRCT